MLKDLIKLANHLDSKGFTKEADYLDFIMKKATELPEYEIDASEMAVLEILSQVLKSLMKAESFKVNKIYEEIMVPKNLANNLYKSIQEILDSNSTDIISSIDERIKDVVIDGNNIISFEVIISDDEKYFTKTFIEFITGNEEMNDLGIHSYKEYPVGTGDIQEARLSISIG